MALQPAYQHSEGIPMSEEDYLLTEADATTKHEYIDGRAYAMTGASVNHGRLSGNVFGEIRSHLKGKPCEAFATDIKIPLKIAAGKDYVYPDVVVDCSALEGKSYFANAPVLLVEVLSPSTRKLDMTTKLLRYINLPSLQEYVLIEQDIVQIQVLRKSNGWQSEYFYLGDSVTFTAIGLTLAVEAVYERVDNQAMTEYREQLGLE
jgi:Uma2 family endonuclease